MASFDPSSGAVRRALGKDRSGKAAKAMEDENARIDRELLALAKAEGLHEGFLGDM